MIVVIWWDLLLLAHNYDCEHALGRYVLSAFESGKPVTIDQCRAFFGPSKIEVPNIITQQHSIKDYDNLMGWRPWLMFKAYPFYSKNYA